MKAVTPRRSFGKTLLAAWRRLCYKLTYHRLFSVSLKQWIWALVVFPPLVALIGLVSWTWATLLSALGVAALIGVESARRKQYIVFDVKDEAAEAKEGTQRFTEGVQSDTEGGRERESDLAAGARVGTQRSTEGVQSDTEGGRERAEPIEVDEPLRCWVSGRLGVEGKARALAGERASISFVRTREHIVMAQVRRTRFLLLAPVSKADVGYWYAFFYPGHVHAVRQGTLYCGFSIRPGLELRYAGEEAGQSVQLYLAFEDLGARQRMLDDLRRDVGQEAF